MKSILVVNTGSSSLKVSLFQVEQGEYSVLFKESCLLSKSIGVGEGLRLILDTMKPKYKDAFLDLSGVGHRFVHGGEQYRSSVCIDKEIILNLEKLTELAPLHNSACLEGIKASLAYFGHKIPQIAVFDTAFHSTLPLVASRYAIAQEVAEKYTIKRYGFHGISHAFLWSVYAQAISKKANIITLHLGAGCSMTAIQEGVSIETSMGFTPAEGLVMATRAGDIDAAIVEFLAVHEKKSASEVLELINFQSGLLGVSRMSESMEVLTRAYEENERARFAVDLFCYRILKYIGAYLAVLGGAEAIIFSGGIGENSPIIRKKIIQKMGWYGVKIDEEANEQAIPSSGIKKISLRDSTIAVYVIATDENLFIAKEVAAFLIAIESQQERRGLLNG